MERILIVGCGDIGLRVAGLLHGRYRLYGLLRDPARSQRLRHAGVCPVSGDLDTRASLGRLSGLADVVLHFAPPPNAGEGDPRTRNLLAALSRGRLPRRLVYISTSGVYGDCGGELFDETRPVDPQSARAWRRVSAERQLRQWGARNGVAIIVLRVPGIYSAERLPLARLRAGTPAFVESGDGYTNHIHAEDLANCVVAALRYGRAGRVYHTADDGELKLGEYFDAIADTFGLPRPPRFPREEVRRQVSPELWSFMGESRRLDNTRMRVELKVGLRYPSVIDALEKIRSRIDSTDTDG